ncbi:hypothetical protein BC940DRAFT_313659 [Gongronella butleri]|nr:hypothetical protein BC940DRAFT_313659 [Gongronella butleri]
MTRGLPNELIDQILTHVPSSNLIPWASVAIVVHELVRRLQMGDLSLRVYVEQESRWKYCVDMELVKVHGDGQCLFAPSRRNAPFFCRFYTSALLRQPLLCRVALIDTLQESDRDDAPMWTACKDQNRANAFFRLFGRHALRYEAHDACLVPNVLPRSTPIQIKRVGSACVTRTSAKRAPQLVYLTQRTPPSVLKARPGERWLQPRQLHLHLDWLWQSRATTMHWWHKIPITRWVADLPAAFRTFPKRTHC